jgi:hypothetical protein
MSLLLCSCATEKAGRSRLPATVAMNKDAGGGAVLIAEVRLADGEKLPVVVDTGAPLTAFDKSVEPKLGERLYTATLLNFGVTQEAGVYAAPKLFLGNVALQMDGTNTVTFDRQKLADRDWPLIRGFLGMDVLKRKNNPSPYLDTGTWDVVKKGDSSSYHYAFTRAAKNGPWKLERAWRTDQSGRTVEEYRVP